MYGAVGLNRIFEAPRLAAGVLVAASVLLGVLGGSAYYACNIYNPSLLLPGDGGTQGDGYPCAHVAPPPRPTMVPDVDAEVPIVAAFNSIDIGVRSNGHVAHFGYDLDNVCTCPGPPSCAQQEGGAESCDDEAGRDDTAVKLFQALGATTPAGTLQIDQGLSSGQYGLLLSISGYNLQADDDQVGVSFYISNGLNRAADGGIPTPQLNGSDLWTIDPGSLQNGTTQEVLQITSCAGNPKCQPLFTADRAYVSQGSVVAHMASIPISFGLRSYLGGATMNLSDAIIVGKLEQVNLTDGLSYRLTGGTIAGRWPTSKLLSTLSTIADPVVDGGFLCTGSYTYAVIRTVVCGAADISQTPLNDNNTPLAPCDAVSVGMQFTAVPAQLGGVLLVPPAPAGCRNGGVPFSDTCSH